MDWQTKFDLMEDAELCLGEAMDSLKLAGEIDLAALVESVVEFVKDAKREAGDNAEREREADDCALRLEYERSAV